MSSHHDSNQWYFPRLWIGIGCQQNTPEVVIEQAIQQVFQRYCLDECEVAGLATLDLKADEAGILAFCQKHELPLTYFSAEALRSVQVPTPSSTVAAKVGTSSVAEAAALLAASSGSILRVPKQVCRFTDYPGAVTLAVAEAKLPIVESRSPLFGL